MTTEAFNLVAHLERQREFSLATFGPGKRLPGILALLGDGIDDLSAAPSDLMKWANLVLQAFDGAWRQGFEPADIVAAIAVKHALNEKTDWPECKLDRIRRAPVPTGDESVDMLEKLIEQFGAPGPILGNVHPLIRQAKAVVEAARQRMEG